MLAPVSQLSMWSVPQPVQEPSAPRNYEVYHDESKVNGYWHGILLVPEDRKCILLDYLGLARNNTGYGYALSLKKVRNRTRMYDCARSWVTIGVAALASRLKYQPVPMYLGTGAGREPDYRRLGQAIGAKLIVFVERDNLARLSPYLDYGGKVETTFRMGLKGGLHYLFSADDAVSVTRLHFDGYEHQQRHIDQQRIVGRLKGLRPYCTVAEAPDLIDDRTSDHRKPDSQAYDDCQLLQLTDLLIGCVRAISTKGSKELHRDLARPVGALVARQRQGHARMENSRWRKGFCMSMCYLEDSTWQFEDLPCPDSAGTSQASLFNLCS